jgi:hypothetical protein
VGALVALAGCTSHFEVPVPAVATAAPVIPPQPDAVIALPVTIALARVRAQLDSVFPPSDSLDRARCSALGGVVCHQYVYRRDSLDLQMRADRVSLATHLRYRGRVVLPGVGGIGSCGYAPEDMRRANLRFATTLYWRNDWRLGARNTQLGADLVDRCTVTMLHVDATGAMRALVDAQAASFTKQIDSIIPAVADLRPAADSLWRLMQRPLALDSTSTLWLAINPASMRLAPLTGSGDAVSSALVVVAHPRVTAGAAPAAPLAPLPALALAGATSGIRLPVQVEVSFADLGARVSALLAGETAGKGTRVREVAIWGVGDTAVVRLGIEGRVSGNLYMLGRVAYDDAQRTVQIRDLRYTLASSGMMSSIKATLGAGRIRSAVEEATGHGQLQVGAQLDSLRTRLTAALNRDLAPGVTLSGQVTDVRIGALYTTSTAFVLRVELDADARVDVH